MKVLTERSTLSRTSADQRDHSGHARDRQRWYSRWYSRCTQALMRFSRLSAVTWPQNAIQKAHSM